MPCWGSLASTVHCHSRRVGSSRSRRLVRPCCVTPMAAEPTRRPLAGTSCQLPRTSCQLPRTSCQLPRTRPVHGVAQGGAHVEQVDERGGHGDDPEGAEEPDQQGE